jgi:hypothetical protein
MIYYFYKITNTINGKYYYGVHSSKEKNDEYYGSGKAIRSAIKKYGKENFTKEILKTFDNETEMYEYEKQFINECTLNDSMCYNLTIGGNGGFYHINSTNKMKGLNNPAHRPDVKKKMVDTARKNGSYHTQKRKKAQEYRTKLAAISNTGKKRPEHSEKMKIKVKELWKDDTYRSNVIDAISGSYEITSPKGDTIITNRLGEFCKQYNLAFVTMWKISETGIPAKKGRCKNWYIKKLTIERLKEQPENV